MEGFVQITISDQNGKIIYNISRAKPENSNSTLLNVTVYPGGKAPPHSHSGEEIIKVIKNEIDIVFPEEFSEERKRWFLKEGDFLHFDSSKEHYKENKSKKVTELFIVRIINDL